MTHITLAIHSAFKNRINSDAEYVTEYNYYYYYYYITNKRFFYF
jgi:hypothetical protein